MRVKLKQGAENSLLRVIKFSTLGGRGVRHLITLNDVKCVKEGLNNGSPELLGLLREHFGHDTIFRMRPEHNDRVLVVPPNIGGKSQSFNCDGLMYSVHLAPKNDRMWKPAILTSNTGDCPHILIHGDFLTEKHDPIRVIGLVHSGWSGCAKNIVGNAMKQVTENLGCPLKNLRVGLLGGICVRCYEVGEDVWKKMIPYHRHFHKGRDKKHWQLDLRGVITQQLIQAGIRQKQIETSMLCSHCQRERNGKHVFFSSRRGETGRNGLFISATR